MNVKWMTLKAFEAGTENRLEACKGQWYVWRRVGCRRDGEMVEAKHSGILYEMRRELAFHAALDVSELKSYADSGGSSSKDKDAER